jgi:hypothetical protein
MSAKTNETPDLMQLMQQMSEFWRNAMDTKGEVGKAWSDSMMPFMAARMAEGNSFTAGQGGEIAEAIKRMAQGPRLADMWDFDRRVMETMAAWLDIRQRTASYSAIAAAPWKRAMDRYNSTRQADESAKDESRDDWRKSFADWTSIANEELIRNQRSDEFLVAQRDLLKSALELRSRQQDLADTAAKLFGLPTQQDLDEVTRQLTELRREFRAYVRSQRTIAETCAPEINVTAKSQNAAQPKKTSRRRQ